MTRIKGLLFGSTDLHFQLLRPKVPCFETCFKSVKNFQLKIEIGRIQTNMNFWQGGQCFFFICRKKKTPKQTKSKHFTLICFLTRCFLLFFFFLIWTDVPFRFSSTVLKKHASNLESNTKKFIVGGRQHFFRHRYAGLVSLFVCFPFSFSRLFFVVIHFRYASNLFIYWLIFQNWQQNEKTVIPTSLFSKQLVTICAQGCPEIAPDLQITF